MKRKQYLTLAIILLIALAAVAVAISLSGNTPSVQINYAAIPQSRAADGAFVLGDANAPVTIIEVADFACPHCQEYHPEIQRFIQDYVVHGHARFEYRLFATTAGGPQQSVFMSQLAECADELQPGAFWHAYDVLYELGANRAQYFSENAARDFAQRVGITDYSTLLTCSANADQIDIDMEFGRAHGITGTPAVMVRYPNMEPQWITYNGQTYSSGKVPYDVLAAVVENNS